jgi:hypothetical protein
MKNLTRLTSLALIASVSIVIGTKLSASDLGIQASGTNILLSWPSPTGTELYLVQRRQTLNVSEDWVSLTNLYRANGTNRTIFVDFGALPPSSQEQGSQSGGGTTLPLIGSMQRAASFGNESSNGDDASTVLLPPSPWDSETPPSTGTVMQQMNIPGVEFQNSSSSQSNSPETPPKTGFYRVLDVSPAAQADYFSVDQDSAQNQLNILQNDSDPNDDYLIISNVTSANHGYIEYNTDGSLFQYPVSGELIPSIIP